MSVCFVIKAKKNRRGAMLQLLHLLIENEIDFIRLIEQHILSFFRQENHLFHQQLLL